MPARLFEATVLPHLDAAFNFARWLTRDDAEAEDVVQDACLRALRYFSSLRDGDARTWLFAIVQNTWYSRLARQTDVTKTLERPQNEPPDHALDPEARLLQRGTI